MGGEFFTDFKSSNGIEISWLVQALSNFYWFWGSTPLGGWQMGAWGWGWVWVCGGCPIHTHMHTHACTYARTYMLNMLNMDASMSAAICNFYTCIHVCMCVCVHACACALGHLPMPPDTPDTPPPTCPLPRAAGSPKQQNSMSWTNRDNSILFKDSLPLNIPELT